MNNTFQLGQFTTGIYGFLLPPIWMDDWDVFHGTFLDDTFSGGSGNDMMWGSVGADTFFGGAGVDTVNYSNVGAPYRGYSGLGVEVDLDAGIGKRGLAEGDRYSSVENVIGTAFKDTIVGSAAKNKILTGDGADRVIISDGNDFLDGGDSVDSLHLIRHDDVTIDLLNGRGIGGIADGDTYVNFENVVAQGDRNALIGNDQDNLLIIYGNEYSIDALGGNDILQIDTLTNGHLDGGAGIDKLDLVELWQATIIDLARGELRFVDDAPGDPITTVTGIEHVRGTDKSDVFIDGRGDNSFRGLGGADTFVFDHDFSGERDVIENFRPSAGHRIDLSQTNVRDYNDLMNGGNRRIEEVGPDTIIYTGNDNQIILSWSTGLGLTEDHFIF